MAHSIIQTSNSKIRSWRWPVWTPSRKDAWRWTDRNWNTRIAPILQSDGQAKPEQPPPHGTRGPVPPWLAILDPIRFEIVFRHSENLVPDPRRRDSERWDSVSAGSTFTARNEPSGAE